MATLLNRRRYMGGGGGLPYDYEVQYIETDGASYIDTGIKISSDVTFDITFDLPDPASSSGFLFGGSVSDNSGCLGFECSNPKVWHYNNGRATHNNTCPYGWNTFNNTQSENSIVINNTITITRTSATFSTNKNFYILAYNGATISYSGNGTRFISAKIYVSGILTMDLIPVCKNNVGYVYDKISNKLFENKGIGNFIVGPEFPNVDTMVEVDYIQCNGTQWVDLGVLPTNNTVVKIKFMNLQTTGDVIFGMYNGENYSYRFFNYGSNIYFDTGNGTSNGRLNSGVIHIYINTLYEIELGNKYVKDIINNITVTGTTYNYTYTKNLTLNCAENITSALRALSKNRWYSVKVYEGQNLILDLIPVRVGQIGYMYDNVSGKFLYNKGRGDFVLGNDKTI